LASSGSVTGVTGVTDGTDRTDVKRLWNKFRITAVVDGCGRQLSNAIGEPQAVLVMQGARGSSEDVRGNGILVLLVSANGFPCTFSGMYKSMSHSRLTGFVIFKFEVIDSLFYKLLQ
jgi:hypothetical protein